jgi:ABC-type glycerol-3-phosphate transport system substrate-binding protein
MRFLNSAENQLAFAKISGLVVPTNKKAHADTFVTAQDDTLAQARSIMVASLDKTRPAERLLPYPLKPDVRAKLFDSLNKAQATVWNREKRPQDALNEAAKAWNEVLKSL